MTPQFPDAYPNPLYRPYNTPPNNELPKADFYNNNAWASTEDENRNYDYDNGDLNSLDNNYSSNDTKDIYIPNPLFRICKKDSSKESVSGKEASTHSKFKHYDYDNDNNQVIENTNEIKSSENIENVSNLIWEDFT